MTLPLDDIFRTVADTIYSHVICEAREVSSLLDATRRYIKIQPHFNGEISLANPNQAPLEMGFFFEADFNVRFAGAGATVGMNPGFAITPTPDGYIDVRTLSKNVRVVGFQPGENSIKQRIEDALDNRVPQGIEAQVNSRLDVRPPFEVPCDANAADGGRQECFDKVLAGFALQCATTGSEVACLAPEATTPANFFCFDDGICGLHPIVQGVNVLPTGIEFVFAPNPLNMDAPLDKLFRALPELGVELPFSCRDAIRPIAIENQPVTSLQLGETTRETPPIPCGELD